MLHLSVPGIVSAVGGCSGDSAGEAKTTATGPPTPGAGSATLVAVAGGGSSTVGWMA